MSRKRRTQSPVVTKNLRVEKRISRYVELFKKVIDDYEEDNPNWRGQTLLWLIKFGLLSLQHYVESEKETEVTWDWGEVFVARKIILLF